MNKTKRRFLLLSSVVPLAVLLSPKARDRARNLVLRGSFAREPFDWDQYEDLAHEYGVRRYADWA